MIKILNNEIQFEKIVPIYEFNNIEELIQAYKNQEITLGDVVSKTNEYLKETKKLNYIIDVNVEKTSNYIKQQVETLQKLKENYSWEELFEKYPLWGIPTLIKDNTDIEGLATTSGSKYFIDNIASKSAKSVTTLQNLGAIIVAKTNLSEFSGMSAQHGISELGSKTVNALNPNWETSGSSSGSAVAASLGFPIVIGTETYGSIICPSVSCGVYGWKPEQSLLTDSCGIPISFYYDTVGIITSSFSNLNYISQNLITLTNTISKKVIIDYSAIFSALGLEFWNKNELDIKNMLNKVKDVLIANNYDVSINELSVEKTIPVLINVCNNFLSDLEDDVTKWMSTKKGYNFKEYMNYAQSLPDHFNCYENGQVVDVTTRKKSILAAQEFYNENYADADIVIADAFAATLLSAFSKNPSLCIPLGISNDSIKSLGLCAKNSQILMEVTKILNDNLDKLI